MHSEADHVVAWRPSLEAQASPAANTTAGAALIGSLTANYFVQRASSQTPQPVLRICVHPFTGGIRFLTHGSCVSPEYLVQWNQQGIQGEQGEQGEQGIQGEQGPPGDTSHLVPQTEMMAFCAIGDEVTSGGYEFIYDQDRYITPHVVIDRPYEQTVGGGDDEGGEPVIQEGWIIQLFHDGSPVFVQVYAVCLTDAGETYTVNQLHEIEDEGGEEGGGGDGR